MKLVTTEPAVNEKYDAEVLRDLWAGLSQWGRCVGLLPGSHEPDFPSCLNQRCNSGSVPFHSGIGQSSESLDTPLGAATKVKGLGQASTQFTCGVQAALSALGFCMKIP